MFCVLTVKEKDSWKQKQRRIKLYSASANFLTETFYWDVWHPVSNKEGSGLLRILHMCDAGKEEEKKQSTQSDFF